jgi:hypothetical protein
MAWASEMLVASKASVGRPSISSVYVRKDDWVDDLPGFCRRNKSLQSVAEVHLRLKSAMSFVAPRMIVNWGAAVPVRRAVTASLLCRLAARHAYLACTRIEFFPAPTATFADEQRSKNWIERAKRKYFRRFSGELA